MTYKNLLLKYIEASGLSLRKIAELCSNEKNTHISHVTLSKIVKGQTPPPSDDITRAIAGVTNQDPFELLWLGFTEKAPKEFIQGLKGIDYKELLTSKISDSLFVVPETPDSEKILSNALLGSSKSLFEGLFKLCLHLYASYEPPQYKKRLQNMIDLYIALPDEDKNELLYLAEYKSFRAAEKEEIDNNYIDEDKKERA